MLETAIVAARLAGARAMEEIKYTKTSVKNENEIVTQTDRTCQDLIIQRIKQTYPDHGFIAEEGPDGAILSQPPRSADAVWWVIDPIDGTNNFAHGMLCFTVSIAAVHHGKPIVGVIFEPATDSMYTSATNMDAQLNTSTITARDADISKLESFGIDSHISDQSTAGMIEVMKLTRFRNLGTTALQLAYTAKGSLLGTIALCARVWDFAAGAIIVQNAGAIITDFEGKEVFPIDLDIYSGQQYQILAANKKTHPKFVKIFGK